MSRIEELIKKHCPDGVEYKSLGEIATLTKGKNLQKKDFVSEGAGCIHYGQIYTHYGLGAYTTISFVSPCETSRFTPVHHGDIVMAVTSENIEDAGKSVVWLGDGVIYTGAHSMVLSTNENAKYLVYYFQTEDFSRQKRKLAQGAKVIELKREALAKITIPVPPIEVQQEIVRVLDAMCELEAKLQEELEAREKQFEACRQELIETAPKTIVSRINDLCDVFTGGEPPEKHTKDVDVDTGCVYPIWGNGKEVYGYSDNYRIEDDSVCISSIGANTGAIFYREGKFTPIIRLKVLVPKTTDMNVRYLYHALHLIKVGRKSSSVPNINTNDVKRIEVSLPPTEIQREIVAKLDAFEALIQNLRDEIAARHAQYVHYRDALLTFEKLEA